MYGGLHVYVDSQTVLEHHRFFDIVYMYIGTPAERENKTLVVFSHTIATLNKEGEREGAQHVHV